MPTIEVHITDEQERLLNEAHIHRGHALTQHTSTPRDEVYKKVNSYFDVLVREILYGDIVKATMLAESFRDKRY